MSIKKQKEFLNVDNKSFEVTTYEKVNIFKSFLDDQSYIRYYKCLAFIIGIKETIILQDLISKDNYFNGNNSDWFFNTSENIYLDTAIPIDSQKRLLDKLVNYDLLEIKFEGMPRRKYFKINYDKVKEISYKGINAREALGNRSVKMTDKVPSKCRIINNNNINKNNILSKDNKRVYKKTLSFEESSDLTQYIINTFYDKIKVLKPKCRKDTFYNNKEVYLVEDLLKKFNMGFSKLNYNKLRCFIKEKGIDFNMDKGFNDKNLLKNLFDIAVGVYDIDYNPSDKSKLPIKTSDFLYNSFMNWCSYFLYYGYNPPKKLKIEVKKRKSKYPLFTEKYRNGLKELGLSMSSVDDNNKLIIFIEKIIKEHNKIVNRSIEVSGKVYKRCVFEGDSFILYLFNIDTFIDKHLEYLRSNVELNDKFTLNLDKLWVSGHWWNLFIEWLERNYNVKVYPDDKYLIEKYEHFLFRKSKDEDIY